MKINKKIEAVGLTITDLFARGEGGEYQLEETDTPGVRGRGTA